MSVLIENLFFPGRPVTCRRVQGAVNYILPITERSVIAMTSDHEVCQQFSFLHSCVEAVHCRNVPTSFALDIQ